MFDRLGIKWNARQSLCWNRGMTILAAFVAGLSGGFFNIVSNLYKESVKDMPFNKPFLYATVLLLLATIMFGALFSNVLMVGIRGWFWRYVRGYVCRPNEFFAGFQHYGQVLEVTLLRDIYLFLWSLLFIIPGIIKSYSYSMTEYILYENPKAAGRAIAMSEKMTEGYKMDLFVMDLSFYGWTLLSSLTCGILGIVFVDPYRYAAHALTYDWLKNNAIQSGRLTWEDFTQP